MKPHQRIAISLLFLSPADDTGGSVYTRNLLDHLFIIDTENQYSLILNARNRAYFKKRYDTHTNVSFHVIDIRFDCLRNPLRAFRKILAKLRGDEKMTEEMVRKELQTIRDKHAIECIFFPTQVIYPRNLTNVRIITTIYDLQHEYIPVNFSERQLRVRKENARYAAEHSDRLIAISHFTKQTLMEQYNTPAERVATIYFGIPRAEPRKEPAFPAPYLFLLYPAALWPHKNHALVLEALAALKDEFPDLHVVFTGVIKKNELKKTLEERAIKKGIRERLHFLGYVSDETLAKLYGKATALIFPSSFEGFGLPLLEAFSYGVPVIAANNTSITEVVGDAGLLFETNHREQFAACIRKVLTDNTLRAHLIQKGYARARLFSWEKTARETLAVFEGLGTI